MRHLRYLPLTYLAGIHGFAIFAPYLLLCTGVFLIFRKPAPVPVLAAQS